MRAIVRLIAIISIVVVYRAAFEATGLAWVGIISGAVVLTAIAWWWRRPPVIQPDFDMSLLSHPTHPTLSGWHDDPEGQGRYQASWNEERWTKTRRLPRPTPVKLVGSMLWAILCASVIGISIYGLLATGEGESAVAQDDQSMTALVASLSIALVALIVLVRRAAGIRRVSIASRLRNRALAAEGESWESPGGG